MSALPLTQILAKPRVYRHILYNMSTHSFIPSREYGLPNSAPRVVPLAMHLRRFCALVLMESYLTWFSLCAHPHTMAKMRLLPQDLHEFAQIVRSPAALGALRVCLSTFVHKSCMHISLILGCTAVQWMWRKKHRSRMYWDMYAMHLPSVAMLYASLSTVLLLALRVVWASREPSAHFEAYNTVIPTSIMHKISAYIPLAAHGGMTEWSIRNVMGGMSAGVAIAAVVPMRPVLGAVVVLVSLSVQMLVRERLRVPWDASLLPWDALSQFCTSISS